MDSGTISDADLRRHQLATARRTVPQSSLISPTWSTTSDFKQARMHNIDGNDNGHYEVRHCQNYRHRPWAWFPQKESELVALVGETITPTGIGGENAFKI